MFVDRSTHKGTSTEEQISSLQETAAAMTEAMDQKDAQISELEKQIAELKGAK